MRKLAQPFLFLASLAFVLAVTSAPAQAQTVDPSTLFPSTCATSSCTFLVGGEIVGVNGDSITLLLNGGGQTIPAGTGQLFLIIGIPNPPGGSAPSINKVGGAAASISPTSAGTPFSTGDLYGFLGLPGNSSQHFTTLAGADSSVLGINGVTSFGIYEYNLSAYGLNGNGTLTVNFSGAGLPLGTFVAGWGCSDSSAECSTGTPYSTPITQAGLVVNGQVPEPGSLALLGTGLLALGGAIRRRKNGISAPVA